MEVEKLKYLRNRGDSEARKSSRVGWACFAVPGEGVVVCFSTEGAHVGWVILLVGAGGAFSAFDIKHDTDFAAVRGAEGAVGELGPCWLPVGEFPRV